MNNEKGEEGEQFVIDLVPCPNCEKKLMPLPKHYPLYDVQCTACYFRAQVKSRRFAPRNMTTGSSWDILDKVMKSGHLIPPLFISWQWKNIHEIRFYPFLAKENVRKYSLANGNNRFSYVGLNTLPHFVVYRNET